MSEYLGTLHHFKLSKDGDTLIVESWRDQSFLKEYDWPDNLDKGNLNELHDRFYLKMYSAYSE